MTAYACDGSSIAVPKSSTKRWNKFYHFPSRFEGIPMEFSGYALHPSLVSILLRIVSLVDVKLIQQRIYLDKMPSVVDGGQFRYPSAFPKGYDCTWLPPLRNCCLSISGYQKYYDVQNCAKGKSTSSHLVPYTSLPFLSGNFLQHINFEVWHSLNLVSYLHRMVWWFIFYLRSSYRYERWHYVLSELGRVFPFSAIILISFSLPFSQNDSCADHVTMMSLYETNSRYWTSSQPWNSSRIAF